MTTETGAEGSKKKRGPKAKMSEHVHHAQQATKGFFDRNPWTGRIIKVVGLSAFGTGCYILGKRSGMSPIEVITKSAQVAAQL
jgi:hypothetical protein